ncbi:hypothetical protein I551_8334 [Mycobacterium ulcerans str. Harvey]|uniref:Secreted protein n=1 Tax=Mycobacterium ulcerans str. Harvey TaxID=1299332 RepID=A0ABP3A0S8_MYCUL|nr:hypothetical protein I551_8334 [Mycobacterium ulcerans str. Harvey]
MPALSEFLGRLVLLPTTPAAAAGTGPVPAASEKTFRAVLSRLDPHGSWPISLRIRSCTRYIRSRVMARNPASSTSSTTA